MEYALAMMAQGLQHVPGERPDVNTSLGLNLAEGDGILRFALSEDTAIEFQTGGNANLL